MTNYFKTKFALAASLFMLCMLCISSSTFAQKTTADQLNQQGEVVSNDGGVLTQPSGKYFEIPTYRGMSNEGGIIMFSDQKTFDFIYWDLDARIQDWGRNVIKEEITPPLVRGLDCYDDNEVLYFFEAKYKMNSLRREIMNNECVMLSKGTHPSRIPSFWTPDDILQSFLNKDAVLQIGKKIYWLKDATTTVIIHTGDRRILDRLLQGANPNDIKGVEVVNTTSADCTAAFNVTGVSGSTANFQFTGTTSTNMGVSYYWTFGDSNTSTDKNPTHNYNGVGDFEVCVTVSVTSDDGDCSDQTCSTITIGSCTASFVTSGITGLTANFQFTGAPTPSQASNVAYHWTFGDSNTSSDQNPTHTYAEDGDYEVCVTVTVGSFCQETYCGTVNLNVFCQAAFIYDQVGGVAGQVCFTDLSEILSGDEVVSWEWDFGNTEESTEKDPCTSYPCNDEYTAKLKITTALGCTSEIPVPVDVTSHYCCGKGYNKGEVEFNNGSKLIKYKQKDQNVIFARGPRARVKHYKKKNNGGWKKEKADLKICLTGDIYKDDGSGCSCQNDIDITSCSTTKHKKKLVYRKGTGSGKISSKKGEEWTASYQVNGSTISTQTSEVTCNN